MLSKDHVLIYMFTLDVDGEIRGKLSIGTATLNSFCLKDKASHMPRGEKWAETAPTLQAPSPKEKHTTPVLLVSQISGGSLD